MLEPVIKQLVNDLRLLPGIGERSAYRMAILLFRKPESAKRLMRSLQSSIEHISPCTQCRNFTSQVHCSICKDDERQSNQLCVVSQPQDILAIENSGAYTGHYFVLHGLLSPLDDIGTDELGLPLLKQRLTKITEIVLALSLTVEGEATASLLTDIALQHGLEVTRLAQGIPMGGEVANMDNLTLCHALSERKRFS